MESDKTVAPPLAVVDRSGGGGVTCPSRCWSWPCSFRLCRGRWWGWGYLPQPVLVMAVLLSSVPRALVGVGLLAPAGVGHGRAPFVCAEGAGGGGVTCPSRCWSWPCSFRLCRGRWWGWGYLPQPVLVITVLLSCWFGDLAGSRRYLVRASTRTRSHDHRGWAGV